MSWSSKTFAIDSLVEPSVAAIVSRGGESGDDPYKTKIAMSENAVERKRTPLSVEKGRRLGKWNLPLLVWKSTERRCDEGKNFKFDLVNPWFYAPFLRKSQYHDT